LGRKRILEIHYKSTLGIFIVFFSLSLPVLSQKELKEKQRTKFSTDWLKEKE
jgi:hypothetical protein